MALQQEFTEQETKQLISELAAKTNSFKIRVQRRHPSGGSKVIALFEEGTADQIAFAEKWLPDLAGGGQYSIYAFHNATDSMKQIGSPLVLSIDNLPPRDVDTSIVRSSAWIGPTGLSYPLPSKAPSNGAMHFEGGAGAEATGPQLGATTPLAGVKTVGTSDPLTLALEKSQQYEKLLEQERARNQIQAIKDQSDRAIKTLETQVQNLIAENREARARADAQIAALTSAAPKESGADSIAKLLAAAGPLLAPLLQGQNDMKLKMMDLESKSAQAALEAARYQSDQLNKLLATMLDKPKGIDPVMQLVLDQLKDRGAKESPLSAMQGAMQLITAAKDAGIMGGEGGGAGEVAIEIARAATAAFEAWVASKAGAPPPALAPAAQQTVMLPQQPQRQPRITVMQRLDQLIKAHHNTVETAGFFMDALVKDAEVKQRFAAEGSDHEAFFKRYWAAWAMTNVALHGPYVMALNDAVLKAAAARGWLPSAPAAQQGAQQPAAATQPPPAAQQTVTTPAAPTSVQQAVAAMQHEPADLVDPGDTAHGEANGDAAGAAEDEDEPVDEEEAQVQ